MPTNYFDENKRDRYKGHSLGNTYSKRSGIYPLPLAENPPTDPVARSTWSPVVLVRAHAEILTRDVDYDVTKEGEPPVHPAMTDSGAFTLLSAAQFIHPPQITSNGLEFKWRVQGSNSYILNADAVTELQRGLILGDWAVATPGQVTLVQQYGGNAQIQGGGLAYAGPIVQAGYNEGLNYDPTSPYSSYYNVAFLSSVFACETLLSGNTVLPPSQ